jgi:hypothetical protein
VVSFCGAQVGTVICYVTLTFDVDVILTGVPPLPFAGGDGIDHMPVVAAPHVTDTSQLENVVRLRYNGIPEFGPYAVMFPANLPGITTTKGGSVTPGPVPCPPVS